MKFSKTLKEKQVQEWRTKYINYEALKQKMAEPEEIFVQELNREIEKVELFYKVLERGILRGLADLLELFPEEEFPYAYELIYDNWKLAMAKSVGVRQKRSRHEKRSKKATQKSRENKVLEFYVALNKVFQYKRMNMTGFRKILKKYDKLNGTSLQEVAMQNIRSKSIFMEQTIEEIMGFTRYIHKEITPNEKRDRAKRLVVDLTQEDAEGDGRSFSAGVLMTAGVFLMSIYGMKCAYYSVLYAWDILMVSFGVLFYICRKNFVNYTLILELNLKPKFKICRYFLMISIIVLIHAVSACLKIPWAVAYAVTVGVYCMPTKYFFTEIRMYFIRSVSEVLACTVLGKVRFKHFFIADHLISIRPAVMLLILWVTESPPSPTISGFIYYTPTIIRIFQCLRRYFDRKKRDPFPHLYNTLKYIISFISDTFLLLSDNVNMWICVASMSISQGFGLYWDVYVDWMLWDRPKVYRSRIYAGVCLFNLVVRTASILSLIFMSLRGQIPLEYKITLKFVQCVMEILRRIVWGVIRIEVEHLNNCNQLKAISGPLNELFYLEDDGNLNDL